jgi:hypothetical protein
MRRKLFGEDIYEGELGFVTIKRYRKIYPMAQAKCTRKTAHSSSVTFSRARRRGQASTSCRTEHIFRGI